MPKLDAKELRKCGVGWCTETQFDEMCVELMRLYEVERTLLEPSPQRHWIDKSDA